MQARVLIVASEAVPLVKTGGLADVITALAIHLRQRHVDASVMIPGYPAALDSARGLREVGVLDRLPGGPGRLWSGTIPDSDVPVVFLDTDRFRARAGNPYVNEDGHEYADNAVCFAALAHAAARICGGDTRLAPPHVVHANDWHAGLLPALLKLHGVRNTGSILTIHNLAFQGNYPMELAQSLGLPAEMLSQDAMEFWGQISFLKGGLRFADRITTVSRTYAREILTARFGHGMEGVLGARSADLVAVPNGVDTDAWNPKTDPLIARHFSSCDMRGKSSCKRDLQQRFGLPVDPFAPILAIGSRMTHQKMADVVLQALPGILDAHPRLQVVALGCGEHAHEHGFIRLAEHHPRRVGVHIGYDEQRAHALHAGADMLLHPTRFEPYGLTPLYSMRYGTVPIASRVGGMIDSIADAGLTGAMAKGGNGILFDGEQPGDITAAIDRAFEMYGRSSDWQALQRNAMHADFSWSGPTDEYIRLYAEIAPSSVQHLFPVRDDAEPGMTEQAADRRYGTA